MAKLIKHLGLILGVIALVVIGVLLLRVPSGQPPRWVGQSAKLPCLANNQCPMGHTCNNGFCAEGFMSPVQTGSNDASSCTSPECKAGINAPCSRSGSPCAEGTFCQNDNCVSITARDQGEAYDQIGMLST